MSVNSEHDMVMHGRTWVLAPINEQSNKIYRLIKHELFRSAYNLPRDLTALPLNLKRAPLLCN